MIPICPSQSQSHVLHQALGISCHNDARLSLIKIIKQLIQTKDWHSHKYPTFPFVLWVEGPDHNVAKKQPFSSLSLSHCLFLSSITNCFLALFFSVLINVKPHYTLVLISSNPAPCPSRIGSTSLLLPISCVSTALRNNRGPEMAIPTAPVGAVRRMDSTAMVKIYRAVKKSC